MPRKIDLRQQRDQYIRDRFRYYRKKYPKWSIEAVISEVAEDIFLSEVTIVKILKRSDESKVPAPATMSKMMKEKALAVA